MAHVPVDQFHHHAPTFLIRRKGLRPARGRNSVEAGPGDGQQDAIRYFLQFEDHPCGRLGGVVDAALKPRRAPPESCSILTSNGMPSYSFWALATSASTIVGAITPRMQAPDANGPSNFMPNQLPNSVEFDNARQTRFRGARDTIFFLDAIRIHATFQSRALIFGVAFADGSAPDRSRCTSARRTPASGL